MRPRGKPREVFDALRHRIEKLYDVYDVDPDDQVAAYFSSADPKQMVDMFEALKDEVAKENRFPLLIRRKEDYALFVIEKPPQKPASAFWIGFLFAATLFSVILAGAKFVHGYQTTIGTALSSEEWGLMNLLEGALWFGLPLLLVVGLHEFALLRTAWRHRIEATLPYFIPLPPPLSPLGTMGALANLRGPIPSRRALVELGAWGPLVSYVAAVAVLALGLFLSDTVVPVSGGAIDDAAIPIGHPLTFTILSQLIGVSPDAELHPLAIAGWIGLFLTAIHLLPGGTLNGGHVVRALFGRRSSWISYLSIAAMVGLGFLWTPWWALAALLFVSGPHHAQPLNDVTTLDWKERILGGLALVVLILSFTPVPLGG